MTEKEFLKEIWRPYDVVKLDGSDVTARVLNVCFSTRSVKVRLPGDKMCDWVRCELIESHTTQSGGACDESSVSESLRVKLADAQEREERLNEKVRQLENKINKSTLPDILRVMNIIRDNIQERKNKMECVDRALDSIEVIVSKYTNQND